MGLSVTEIYNQALSLVGSRFNITSTSNTSREAEVCNHNYPVVRQTVLRAAHWSCARNTKRLSLLAERDFSLEWTNADPSPPWRYAYAHPSDMLHAQFITDYDRFEVGRYDTGNAILTDKEDAILVYTIDETNTALWDILLTSAVFFALAGAISPQLTGSNRKRQELFQEANSRILLAREANANNDHTPIEAMPDWFTARGISGPLNPNRYIYPVGPLFAVSAN